jgi:hypothetical protein
VFLLKMSERRFITSSSCLCPAPCCESVCPPIPLTAHRQSKLPNFVFYAVRVAKVSRVLVLHRICWFSSLYGGVEI